jgi:AcrR family transcriptional regulator
LASAGRPREGAATAEAQPSLTAAVSRRTAAVSHNLHGQKLGRKGRDTRERILAATIELLSGTEEAPISLSAVARRASLGMTSLYNYFADLTELLLAVLDPVMDSSERAYIAMLREHWPDGELAERSLAFVRAYHGFWSSNARLLHLRNSMADAGDRRMMLHRVKSAQPMIGMIVRQMDGDPSLPESFAASMATVVMTGLERTVTVATDEHLTGLFGSANRYPAERYLLPEARLVEIAIRDTRERLARERVRKG